jgi:hypothetical protein
VKELGEDGINAVLANAKPGASVRVGRKGLQGGEVVTTLKINSIVRDEGGDPAIVKLEGGGVLFIVGETWYFSDQPVSLVE